MLPNTGLRGIDFLPPATRGLLDYDHNIIDLLLHPHWVHLDPIECRTIHCRNTHQPLRKHSSRVQSGSAVPLQTIYVWIDGVRQGSVTSNSSGHWTFSFTPTLNRTYYASASQNPDGSGVTSPQLQLAVSPETTTTSTSSSIDHDYGNADYLLHLNQYKFDYNHQHLDYVFDSDHDHSHHEFIEHGYFIEFNDHDH